MRRYEDLTGRRFGRLVVIEETGERQDGSVVWLCVCDCGASAKVNASRLMGGLVKSCGCARGKRLSTGLDEASATVQLIERSATKPMEGIAKFGDKFAASIKVMDTMYALGVYDSVQEAIQAQQKADSKIREMFMTWWAGEHMKGQG